MIIQKNRQLVTTPVIPVISTPDSYKYQEKSERRRDFYKYLTRPDGNILKEKDCLIFDLLYKFTKNNPYFLTEYQWLLKNKFPCHISIITVKRTLANISNYFTHKFYNKIIIDGVTHYNKIVISRVNDFEKKFFDAKNKNIISINKSHPVKSLNNEVNG